MSHTRPTTLLLIAIAGLSVAVRATGIRAEQEPVITPTDDGSGYSLTIWPPNRQLVLVGLSDCVLSVVDAGGNPIDVDSSGTIHRITSDEPAIAQGGDMFILGPASAGLLAARERVTDGRVYTIHYSVYDGSGNRTPAACRVQVPRNQSTPAIDGPVLSCVGVGC